jgi:hypothetical protein
MVQWWKMWLTPAETGWWLEGKAKGTVRKYRQRNKGHQ